MNNKDIIKKTIINDELYESLKEMLSSSNEEDKIYAIGILNSCNYYDQKSWSYLWKLYQIYSFYFQINYESGKEEIIIK